MSPTRPVAPLSLRFVQWLVIVLPLMAAALVLLHTPYVNGPEYWKWPYRRLAGLPLYPLCWLAGGAAVAAAILYGRRKLSGRWAMVLGFFGSLGLMFAASFCDSSPPSATALREVVIDPGASTYLANAITISRDLRTAVMPPAVQPTLMRMLRNYPKAMVRMGTHARIRGPGWILFYMGLLQITGQDINLTATLGAVALGLAAASAGPATAWMIRRLGGTQDQAVYAGLLLALCPAMVLFFPMADPGYCTVTAALCGMWCLACRTGRRLPAAMTGLILGVACFFTYNCLALGIFLLALTAYPLWYGTPARRRRTALQCGLAFVLAAAPYVPLQLATGFNPIATFRQAVTNQQEFQVLAERDGKFTAPTDLYDHSFGTGFVVPMLCIGWFITRKERLSGRTRRFTKWASAAAMLQYAVLVLSQQMPGETARVWLFVTPLLLLPAGICFTRFSAGWRTAIFAVMALIIPVYAQNLKFAGHDFAAPFLQHMRLAPGP